jgi:hypothetical protein
LAVTVLTGAIAAAWPGAVWAASARHSLPVDTVSSQAAGDSPPSLRCTAASPAVQDPGVTLISVSCTVVDAAPEENSFRLRATFQGPGSDGWTLDPFCISPLNDERGECARQLTQPAAAAGGRLAITGALRPSGRELPPSTVTFPARR